MIDFTRLPLGTILVPEYMPKYKIKLESLVDVPGGTAERVALLRRWRGKTVWQMKADGTISNGKNKLCVLTFAQPADKDWAQFLVKGSTFMNDLGERFYVEELRHSDEYPVRTHRYLDKTLENDWTTFTKDLRYRRQARGRRSNDAVFSSLMIPGLTFNPHTSKRDEMPSPFERGLASPQFQELLNADRDRRSKEGLGAYCTAAEEVMDEVFDGTDTDAKAEAMVAKAATNPFEEWQ